jgi:hypothetical protein
LEATLGTRLTCLKAKDFSFADYPLKGWVILLHVAGDNPIEDQPPILLLDTKDRIVILVAISDKGLDKALPTIGIVKLHPHP